MNRFFYRRRGFTLIELLLVIGIIAILASIVIIAINPTKQLGKARNAQRRSDVNTILNAVYQYAIDNNGRLPSAMSGSTFAVDTDFWVCSNDSTLAQCVTGRTGGQSEVRLDPLKGTYIVSIPRDPSRAATETGSWYQIRKDASGRITVKAPLAEDSESISVTR